MRITNPRIEKEHILLHSLLAIAAVLLLVFGVSSLYSAWSGSPARIEPDLNSVAATGSAPQAGEIEAGEAVADETLPSESAEERELVSTTGEVTDEQPVEEQPTEETAADEMPVEAQPAEPAATT